MCIIFPVLVNLANDKVTKRTIPHGCRNNCYLTSCCNVGCEDLSTYSNFLQCPRDAFKFGI